MLRPRHKVLLVVAALCVAYVTSYFLISRCSERSARDEEMVGFYYVPLPRLNDPGWANLHRVLRVLFRPIQCVDYEVFDGPRVLEVPDFGGAAKSCPREAFERISARIANGELTADAYGRVCLPPDLAAEIGRQIVYASRTKNGSLLVLFPYLKVGRRYMSAVLYAGEPLSTLDTQTDREGNQAIAIPGPLVFGRPGTLPRRQALWEVARHTSGNWYDLYDNLEPLLPCADDEPVSGQSGASVPGDRSREPQH